MAVIGKVFSFDSMHSLPHHNGKCIREHGHTYHVEVAVEGDIKPADRSSDSCMVVDFGDVSRVIKPLIEHFCDHYNLNNTLGLFRTTAELIGCWFIGALHPVGFRVAYVRVWETPTSWAEVTVSDWLQVGKPGPSMAMLHKIGAIGNVNGLKTAPVETGRIDTATPNKSGAPRPPFGGERTVRPSLTRGRSYLRPTKGVSPTRGL